MPEPLVIHSGLGGLRKHFHGMIRDVPEIVRRELDGRAVVMPAYTPGFVKSGVFDIVRSKPSTGAICEAFGGTRTHRPMNSYFFKGCRPMWPQTTAWGEDSVMGWLLRNDATFIALGVSTLKSCSYFHYAEEKLKVPYRYFKTFKGLLYDDGRHIGPCSETMYVGPLGVEYDFKAISAIKLLEDTGRIKRRPFMEIIKVRDIVEAAEEVLSSDPYCLIHPTKEGQRKVREYVETGKLENEQENS